MTKIKKKIIKNFLLIKYSLKIYVFFKKKENFKKNNFFYDVNCIYLF